MIGAVKDFPRTYFAQDKQGYFYETMMGPGSFEETVDLILNGDYESCAQVYVLDEGMLKIASHTIADAVLIRWRKTDCRFVPKYLMLHHRDAVQAELAERRTKAEKAFDRAEDEADRIGDQMRDAA